MLKIKANNFNLYYNDFHVLKNINIDIEEKKITAIIGPSGCGKSSFLKSINRINDIVEYMRVNGEIIISGQNIYDKRVDVNSVRKNVGMVFQRPNLFPISIYENISFGLKINKIANNKSTIMAIVEESLSSVMLLHDVKDKLYKSALLLTLEQQQRLCIARVLAINPQIILFDEPCSSLDNVATKKIEELIMKLREKYTVVLVTHNMQQAARISNDTAVMICGRIIEFASTEQIFTCPSKKETESYVTGRFMI
ncbi:MAG: phosphate ABC transporter ATP-binding protein PstB [Endomicrobium sp.]|jgi:phosphate transport system ATP-binding protein|nr:phosphate ABC transporter ATP-binding protein PstB [Endomicrobium sp.]